MPCCSRACSPDAPKKANSPAAGAVRVTLNCGADYWIGFAEADQLDAGHEAASPTRLPMRMMRV